MRMRPSWQQPDRPEMPLQCGIESKRRPNSPFDKTALCSVAKAGTGGNELQENQI